MLFPEEQVEGQQFRLAHKTKHVPQGVPEREVELMTCESMRKSWEENAEIMIGNSYIALIHYLLPQNESGLEGDPNFCTFLPAFA